MAKRTKKLQPIIWRAILPLGVSLGLVACKTSYYQEKADKEVYQIIEEVENQVFGKKSPFTIDTPYSDRNPSEIEPEEIIDERDDIQETQLTIQQAIDLAITHSRDYQTQKEALYLTALSLAGEKWEFSPQFFAGSTLSRDRSSNGDQSGSARSRVTVGQALTTGASLGATLANDLMRFYTGDPRRTAASTLSVNIFQPLLRGAGNLVAREPLRQAERNTIYAIRDFTQFQRQFSIDIVSQFYNLLQQRDIVRNRFADYQSRTNATARLLNRFEAGLETVVGVGQARQAELSSRNGYVNQVASYQTQLDQFKIRLGIPLTHKLQLDDTELNSLAEAGLKETYLPSDWAFSVATTNHLELLNDIDGFEDARRQVKIAANRLRPGLDFFADASVSSDQPTDYTSFDIDDVRAGAGVEIDLPINRYRERNQYRATVVSFERAVRTLSLALDQKRNQIERGLRTLNQLRENYRIETLSVALAEERVTSTDLNIEAGRAVVFDLVQAQDALIAAKNNLSAALVSYLSARLQLLLDIGILDTDIEAYWLKSSPTLIPIPSNGPESDESEELEVITPDILFKVTS